MTEHYAKKDNIISALLPAVRINFTLSRLLYTNSIFRLIVDIEINNLLKAFDIYRTIFNAVQLPYKPIAIIHIE